MRHKTRVKLIHRQASSPSREQNPTGNGQGGEPEFDDLITSIITTCRSPARVLELFYLSQEPGALEILRSLMSLPEGERLALWSFLAGAPNPQEVSVEIDSWDQVTLSAPETVEAMSARRRSAAG